MGIRWTGEVPRQACPAAVVYLTKHFKLDSPLQEVCIMGKISPQCLWGTDDSPPTYFHWLPTGRNLHTQCCTHSQVKDLEKLTRSCTSSDSGHRSEQSQPGSNLAYPQEPLERCLFDQAYLAWLNPLLGECQVICCHPQWMAMAGKFCRTDDSLLDHQAAIALLLPFAHNPPVTGYWLAVTPDLTWLKCISLPGGPGPLAVSLHSCLNDQANIAWFTSTRGVYHSLAWCKHPFFRTKDGPLISLITLTDLSSLSLCCQSSFLIVPTHGLDIRSAVSHPPVRHMEHEGFCV